MTVSNDAPHALLDPVDLVSRIVEGHVLTAAEALQVLATPDHQTLALVAAAGVLRRRTFGRTVKVNYLVNLKSGLCPEDCTYCSQRLGSTAEILKYTWLSPDEAVRQAELGVAGGASRVCMVSSGKGPTHRDVERVAGMVEQLKGEHPDVEVCACLGLLKEGQAERLRTAGVDAYNHNLNTAESKYADICTTHTYADRVDTVGQARDAGLSPCSGLIVGLGETPEQLVEAVLALRDLGSDSIPVNFLMPFDGTPLAGGGRDLTPLFCLRVLALVRLACPDTEVRMAGGREMHLRTLQSTALEVANSLFLGDYLTSEGQAAADDLQMIADAGFVVLGREDEDPAALAATLRADARAAAATADAHSDAGSAAPSGGCCGSTSSAGDDDGHGGCGTPVLRRRGAGTDVAPNA